MSINYLEGNAVEPIIKDGCKNVIIHITNNEQRWASGFVLAVSKKWKRPEKEYMNSVPILGNTQFIEVEPNLYVVNMCAQCGVRPIVSSGFKVPNLQYDALYNCLLKIREEFPDDVRFHFPLIGAVRSGGDWRVISTLVEKILGDSELYCYIYDEEHRYLLEKN